MIDTPHITQSKAQPMAFIRLTVPRSEIRTVMGPAITEVFSVLAAQGIAPAGPWFTHHMCRPTDVFDFEACVPVAQAVTASGRVQPGELPARAKVARTVFHGDYEGLGDAWGKFMQWIEENGYTGEEDLWECYTVGPEAGPDSSAWRTELNKPLKAD